MHDTNDHRLPTFVDVDDNAGDALLLEEALREGGHAAQLMVIGTGDQALRYVDVKESARDLPPPHGILLDAHLPIVTGARILRFVRGSRIHHGTPIYILAAEAACQDLSTVGIASRETVITQPITWDDFLALARRLMDSADAGQNPTPADAWDAHPGRHAAVRAVHRQSREAYRLGATE